MEKTKQNKTEHTKGSKTPMLWSRGAWVWA